MAAPKDPKNRWNEKLWREAIRIAVLRASESDKKRKKLQDLADALVKAGVAGDVPALKEIGDRLDGKVPQAVVGGGADDPPIRTVTRVELVDLTGSK